jgi:hypothetical protein
VLARAQAVNPERGGSDDGKNAGGFPHAIQCL